MAARIFPGFAARITRTINTYAETLGPDKECEGRAFR